MRVCTAPARPVNVCACNGESSLVCDGEKVLVTEVVTALQVQRYEVNVTGELQGVGPQKDVPRDVGMTG